MRLDYAPSLIDRLPVLACSALSEIWRCFITVPHLPPDILTEALWEVTPGYPTAHSAYSCLRSDQSPWKPPASIPLTISSFSHRICARNQYFISSHKNLHTRILPPSNSQYTTTRAPKEKAHWEDSAHVIPT